MRHRPTALTLVLIAAVTVGIGAIAFIGPLLVFIGPLGLIALLSVLFAVGLFSAMRILRPKS
jgi:hypothetical protein